MILLALDILLTIFAPGTWNDYIFYACYLALALVVVLVNAKEKAASVGNLLVPLLIIAGLCFTYGWLLPSLYKAYKDNLSSYSTVFLIIYA